MTARIGNYSRALYAWGKRQLRPARALASVTAGGIVFPGYYSSAVGTTSFVPGVGGSSRREFPTIDKVADAVVDLMKVIGAERVFTSAEIRGLYDSNLTERIASGDLPPLTDDLFENTIGLLYHQKRIFKHEDLGLQLYNQEALIKEASTRLSKINFKSLHHLAQVVADVTAPLFKQFNLYFIDRSGRELVMHLVAGDPGSSYATERELEGRKRWRPVEKDGNFDRLMVGRRDPEGKLHFVLDYESEAAEEGPTFSSKIPGYKERFGNKLGSVLYGVAPIGDSGPHHVAIAVSEWGSDRSFYSVDSPFSCSSTVVNSAIKGLMVTIAGRAQAIIAKQSHITSIESAWKNEKTREDTSGAKIPPAPPVVTPPAVPAKKKSMIRILKNLWAAVLVRWHKFKIKISKNSKAKEHTEIEIARFKNKRGREIVAIVDRPKGTAPKTWIIIPPAYGVRKERYLLLAQFLTRNGYGVIRYDDTNSVGESDGEMRNLILSESAENISAAIDYISRNFPQAKIGIAPVSMAARTALKAASDPRVSFLVPIAGSPNIEDLLSRVWAENLVESYKKGVRRGVINMLGHYVDSDRYLGDAVRSGFSDLESAKRDMQSIKAPIVWLCPQEDLWVDAEQVQAVLSSQPDSRSIRRIEVLAGTNHFFYKDSESARQVFTRVVEVVNELTGVAGKKVEDVNPSGNQIIGRSALEYGRVEKVVTMEHELENWKNYLEDFDLMLSTKEYSELMEDQVRLLNFTGGTVLDLGSATGNFMATLISMIAAGGITAPAKDARIVNIDMVSEALAAAQGKADRLKGQIPNFPKPEFRRMNLDISPIPEFNNGRLEVEHLNRFLPGLNLELGAVADQGEFRQKLRQLTRGELNLEFSELAEIFGIENVEAVWDLVQMSRFLRGEISGEKLNFRKVKLSAKDVTGRLPFEDKSIERVIGSLFISYMRNSKGTLREIRRVLKPGSTTVLSTVKKGADLSKIWDNYQRELKARYSGAELTAKLNEAREQFFKSMGWIEEEIASGRFKDYGKEEFAKFLEGAGFVDVEITESFGGLGWVAAAKAPSS